MEEKEEESLDSMLRRLIAEKDGIKHEEVTVAYICDQREKRLYPNIRYDIGSDYGGYNTTGLTVLTGKELEELEEYADKILSSWDK